jgi:putative oxidoreductase
MRESACYRAALCGRISMSFGSTTPKRTMHVPLPGVLRSTTGRSAFAWAAVRLALAVLIAAHGWARLAAGAVAPFGTFLDAQGFPGGLYFAWAVTMLEIAGSLLLALGRLVAPLCLLFSVVYATGIALVHAKAGWFVVGLGRNGAEYSVLLIVCLLAVGMQHVERRNATSDAPMP